MKASELIAELQKLIEQHGDLEVMYNDEGYADDIDEVYEQEVSYSSDVRGAGSGWAFTEWMHFQPVTKTKRVFSLWPEQ